MIWSRSCSLVESDALLVASTMPEDEVSTVTTNRPELLWFLLLPDGASVSGVSRPSSSTESIELCTER